MKSKTRLTTFQSRFVAFWIYRYCVDEENYKKLENIHGVAGMMQMNLLEVQSKQDFVEAYILDDITNDEMNSDNDLNVQPKIFGRFFKFSHSIPIINSFLYEKQLADFFIRLKVNLSLW